MLDMVSKDRGSFLPASLSNEADCSAGIKSSLKSSSSSPAGEDTGDDGKKKRKKVQRSVSFNEAGPLVQQIDSVKSILEDEFKENQDDPELQESLNGIWYDHHEVETMKQDNAQLIYDKEDELSVASTNNNGGDEGEPDLSELEERFGDSFRGLERQTEEGSWAHFQNRANVLGAVLDTQTDDADELASLASEATEDARSVAQKRALQDEKEAKAYLADVRDMLNRESLNVEMDRLNASNTISFNSPDGDDASVLTTNSSDDDSITSDFTGELDEDEEEVAVDNRFGNIQIDFDKPASRRPSLKERIDQLNSKPAPPPFQAAKSYSEKMAEKSLSGSINSTRTAAQRRASATARRSLPNRNKSFDPRVAARRSLPNRNKSLDLRCPIATMNKPENSIVNKEERWLSNQKIPAGASAKRFSKSWSTSLSLSNHDSQDDDDDDGESLLSGLNKSDTSLGFSLDGNSNHSNKKKDEKGLVIASSSTKKNEKRLSGSSLSLASDLDEDEEDDEKDEVELMDAPAATTLSKKTAKRLPGSSLTSTIDGDKDDEDDDEKDEVELMDADELNRTSDSSLGLSSPKKVKKEGSKKVRRTSSTKANKEEQPAPPELKESTSQASKKNKDAMIAGKTTHNASGTSLSLGASGTALSLAISSDESDVDYDVDAKAAIKALKKNRKKKVQRVKTMPTGGSSNTLDLSCPNMTLNKPASPTKKKKTKPAKDGNASASSDDDQKNTTKQSRKKMVSRSKTMPAGVTSLDESSEAGKPSSSANDQDDGKILKPKKRLSRIESMNDDISQRDIKVGAMIAKTNEHSRDNNSLPTMFKAGSKKKSVRSKRASCTAIPDCNWKDDSVRSCALGTEEDASQSTEEPGFKWQSGAEEPPTLKSRASTGDLDDLEPGAKEPPTLKSRASTGDLGLKKAKKRSSCTALPTVGMKDSQLGSDSQEADEGKNLKEAEEDKGMMGGMLGLLIADAKPDSGKEGLSSSSDEEVDKKARRHTVSGAFGALMSMDLSCKDDSQEDEEQPRQRASTGTTSLKKKTIRSSKSSVGTTSAPKKTHETPRRSKSESKKVLLPSNSSRGAPPRSSSIGSKKEKVKLPSNGRRSSIARIPRRKAAASEATDASNEVLRRSSSSVN